MKKIFSLLAAVLFAGSMMAADVTVSKSVHDLFPDDANGTQEAILYSDANLKISVNDDGNNGKIYGTGTEWRLYHTNNAVITVTATNATIKTVAFEFTVNKNGVLLFGESEMESGTAVNINAASAQFTVDGGETGKTNGQVIVKGFTVVYTPGEGGGSGEGGEGGETGDAISLNDVVYCDAWFNMYDAEYGDLSTWELVLYKGYVNNDWVNPYVSLTVYAASESSIVGTYGFGAELQDAWADIDDETEVEAVSGGDLVVTHDSFHHYRFQFTFVADDGETYTIDKVVNTVAYDITNSDDENAPTIELDEDAEETAISNAEATVKAVKTIENGHLIIERNGVNYNANGQIVR